MTIVGAIVALIGFGGALALFTGVAGSYAPMLAKMPLGLLGWVILGIVGVVLMVLNRRPGD